MESGRVLWSIEGKATTFSGLARVAVSSDGRYALVSTPSDHRGATFALLSLESGGLIQEIPASGTSESNLGFSLDNKTLWIGGSGRLVTYRFDERR